ncbi:MAG: YccF domain-containing protein [Bacteroidaceae bacterium]|nr:YccF domain-containing protein [Bacteroidaceae bacterium]
MKFIGNTIWIVFGGLLLAIEYFFMSLLLMITIIGIPFGLQTFKLVPLALWPFGKEVRSTQEFEGCLSIAMNLLWIIFGGWLIALEHALLGLFFFITIIGIPFGKQHFKLASIALVPFGREVVSSTK